MGFFDQVPQPTMPVPDRARATPPVWWKPGTQMPGSAAGEAILAYTDDAVVAIGGLRAYRTGFEFTLSIVAHRDEVRRSVYDTRVLHRPPGDDPLPPEFLRLGVRFADGRVASNLDQRTYWPGQEPPGPILRAGNGGGGDLRWDGLYWVWPLPPLGPVGFVCQWPIYGIDESSAEIDGQLLHDAAERSIELWPAG